MERVAESQELRIQILALLLYTDWMSRYGTILEPEYFRSNDERDIVRWVNNYYTTYKNSPQQAAVEEGLVDNPLLENVRAVVDDDLRYAADVAIDFAQTQAMKLAILDAVDHVKSGELHRIRPRVEDALKVGCDMLAIGYDLVDDVDHWLYSELHGKRYPTGWRSVDGALGGGMVGGEYGLIMAPPNMGKTTALINIGYASAGLLGASNVLHLTYEMPANKVLKRYALRVTGRSLSRTNTNGRYAETLRSRAKTNLRANLRVARPDDSTIDGIRRILDNLRQVADFDTQVLIVDYADLLDPPRRRRERRFELEDIARELRELGHEYDIPVWSATQAGRQGYHKKYVTMQDIAEAIGKAAIADIIVALCQTQDEEEAGQGRLFMAKVRDGASKFTVPVTIDFSKQAISERGGRFDG